jgi:heme/copper-type cytochrome/quinol oxidase subunit 2
MPPVDLAVWWTEYALRHKETPFLKPKGIHQTWYQRRLVDVWAVVFVAINLILLLIIIVVYKCVCRKAKATPKAKVGSNKIKKK